MRRVLALCLPVLLLAAAPAAAREDVPLAVELETCETGPERTDRRAAFEASMPARPGASVLVMRFALQRRGAAGWSRVRAPVFDRAERSEPGAPGFVFTKQVDGLYSPGTFRAVVRFTWRDGAGRVVARARRTTGPCRQRDWRPDLRPVGVELVAVRDGVATWAVRVRNAGRGPLDLPVEVAVRAGDAPAVRTTLDRVERGDETVVQLATPVCRPGELVRVTADPAGDVRERRESNNALVVACPA